MHRPPPTETASSSEASAPSAPAVVEHAEPNMRERIVLHMPVDVRSLSLVVLAALATIFALRWASAVFIPLMLGLTFSYALGPLVNRLQRARVPRAIGAALLIAVLVGGFGWTAYALSDEAAALIKSLPETAQKVRESVRSKRSPSETAIDKVQKAATQLEQAAQEGTSSARAPERGVTRVQIERPRFDIKDYLWTGTLGLLASLGQATVVVFITYFLLVSGDTFRRKLVKIAGPTFAQKRITVQVLDEITEQIQRYMLVQIFTSVVLGLATGLAFWIIGVNDAAMWGVIACALNFVPYIGAIVLAVASAMVGFTQFGSSFEMAGLISGTSVALHVVSGYLFTPWITSRTSQLNAVVVFVGVLAFGWLWGVWGLVLGVPVLMMVKAVCDRVDHLKPIGELLGT